MITRLFRAAQFDNAHLPETSDIWRGGVGQQRDDWHDVAVGISWTLSREVACWFAFYCPTDRGEPVVLKRTIERRDVLAHFTGRREDEIVITAPGPTMVDGSPKEWRIIAERRTKQIRAEEMARLRARRQRRA